MADHRYVLAIEVEASSFSDLADRLRDLATDIDIGQASPRSLFAGAGSRGHYTLTDRVDHSGSTLKVEAPTLKDEGQPESRLEGDANGRSVASVGDGT